MWVRIPGCGVFFPANWQTVSHISTYLLLPGEYYGEETGQLQRCGRNTPQLSIFDGVESVQPLRTPCPLPQHRMMLARSGARRLLQPISAANMDTASHGSSQSTDNVRSPTTSDAMDELHTIKTKTYLNSSLKINHKNYIPTDMLIVNTTTFF